MEHSHRYHAYPTQEVVEGLQHHLNVHRQLYNHVRWEYENRSEDDKPSEYDQNDKLPERKPKWPVFAELHSKAAQATVARFHRNLSNLQKRKRRDTTVIGSCRSNRRVANLNTPTLGNPRHSGRGGRQVCSLAPLKPINSIGVTPRFFFTPRGVTTDYDRIVADGHNDTAGDLSDFAADRIGECVLNLLEIIAVVPGCRSP